MKDGSGRPYLARTCVHRKSLLPKGPDLVRLAQAGEKHNRRALPGFKVNVHALVSVGAEQMVPVEPELLSRIAATVRDLDRREVGRVGIGGVHTQPDRSDRAVGPGLPLLD